MKDRIPKLALASGFFTLLGALVFITIFIIKDYNLLSKEHAGLFPQNHQFPLNHCKTGSQKNNRSFPFEGKQAETVPVLTYHRIIKESNISKQHYIDGALNPMVVTKEEFTKQMNYLKDNDFVTLTLPEVYLFLIGEMDIPDKSVLLTFNDGYKDNFVEAYPLLKKYDFTAVNFLITGAITKRVQPFNPESDQYFSTKELSKACDVFDYQSHTYNYHRRENNIQNIEVSYLNSRIDEEVTKDIEKSIHNLNGVNLAFSYPYGEYSPSTINIVKDLGFKMAFTTEDRAASPDDHLYEIPRFNILAATTLETFIEYVNN
ncbi:polysaccharide deacetylase family protein [Sporosarcina sp. Marseille-Q4063]|uniref:polysaccharide deacetylase family protein n=1 Tax=Sporosarcina sp. Marseille-Q4063 TaxID=2810514 RepID=UPI001BB03572|nr:polysaccharide deacetylase family protein [Sporosarcina sp. Marseille-Q4063]QUW21932.1 polysaccharide deacetylase family protein [Sporosarcina sp. Marseille-Q4063]